MKRLAISRLCIEEKSSVSPERGFGDAWQALVFDLGTGFYRERSVLLVNAKRSFTSNIPAPPHFLECKKNELKQPARSHRLRSNRVAPIHMYTIRIGVRSSSCTVRLVSRSLPKVIRSKQQINPLLVKTYKLA